MSNDWTDISRRFPREACQRPAWIAPVTADERALAVLVGVFGAVALLLAAVGLYGVLAYQVAQRMREIGIRIALGASTPSISRGVVSRGMRLVALGLAVGIPAALFSARVIENLLFEVGSADVPTLLGVTVFLALVGTVACLLPAARAARVDPVQAFRAE